MMESIVLNDYAGVIKVSRENSPRKPYPHQIDALQRLNEVINKDRYSGLLVLPTGGGKTMTAVRWALKNVINQNKKVLWIAHRHELLKQAIATVEKNAFADVVPDKKEFKYRIISGMHDRPVNIKNDDDIIVASKDSLNHGIAYLSRWIEVNKDNIVLIIDEAHHATAKSYRKIIDLLEKTNKTNFHLLGLTATPYRTSESERGLLAQLFKDGITYGIDLKTLIGRRFLADPVFEEINTKIDLSKELTDKDIKNIQAFDNLPEDVASEIAKSSVRNNLIVNQYIRNQDKYGQMLLFAINVNHAIALSSIFKSSGISSDFVVSSIRDAYTGVTISNEENEEKLKRFREGKIKVLINVNILTEGTDLPNVQSVFLTRPTTSTILMTQMIGRALRGLEAGGTEKAYIVSFIDEWRDKIAWVNPEKLIEYEKIVNDDKPYEKRKHVMRLIGISKIEEFARIMDESVDTSQLEAVSFLERIPVGMYSFSILIPSDKEEEYTKNCDIIVYDSFKQAYEDFIEELDTIFKDKNLEGKEFLDDYEIDYLCSYVEKEYFEGYINPINYKKEDIKDILRYYALKGAKPQFLDFNDRGNYDLFKVAKHIWDNDMGIKQQTSYLNSIWDDEKSFFRVFFGNNKKFFLNQVNVELNKLSNPEMYMISSPQIEKEEVEINKLTLHQIREKNPTYWRYLVNTVYEKAKDSEGYYHSASGEFKSKQRGDFQIDHKHPMSSGGLTVLENLQLLSRYENLIKSNKENGQKVYNEVVNDNSKNDKNELDDTIKSLDELIEECKYNESLNLCDKCLKTFPEESKLYHRKGIILRELKRVNESIDCFEKAIEIEPENLDVYFDKATAYENIEKYDEAINVYHKALEVSPNDLDAINNMGFVMACQSKFKEAIEYYEKALAIEPTYIQANFNMGNAYENMDDYNEAIKWYDKTIYLDRNYVSAYIQKGLILEYQRKTDKALKYFDKVIEIDPNNPDGYWYKANLLNNNKKLEEAMCCYDRAITQGIKDSYIYSGRGYTYRLLKEYDNALSDYNTAILLDNENANAYFGKAYILDIKRKYEEAIKNYDKVIELEPENSIAYNNKGYTLHKMKRYKEAIECYDWALKIDPKCKYSIKNKKCALEKLDAK
jgi:ATP-dependent helicase IRC3